MAAPTAAVAPDAATVQSSERHGAADSATAVVGAKPSPQFDLTSQLAPFLDAHLVLPMFDFHEDTKMYPARDLAEARLELVLKTNMMDYAISLYKEIHGEDAEPPAEYEARGKKVLEEYTERVEAAMAILQFIDNGENGPTDEGFEIINAGNFNAEYLAEVHGVTDEDIQALYKCAKFKYDCGEYDVAANYLYHYRLLVSPDSHESLQATWGKFACEILSEQWDEADRDREKLRAAIYKLATTAYGAEFDTGRERSEHKLRILQQRSWLLHWSLYVFFNKEKGREQLLEVFLQNDALNAIQTNCPWLLRYLAAVLITSKRERHEIKALLKVLLQERSTYRDPILEFVEQLLVNFNFEAAQEKLRECEAVIRSDYFLSFFQQDDEFVRLFLENARLFIFETYCRIHSKVDIGMLASKLSMSEQDAERWVVNMIRNANFDARIDTAGRQVIMATTYPSVHQQVVARTRDLSIRTRMLADAIDEAIHNKDKPPAARKAAGEGGGRGGGRGGGSRGGGRGGGRGGYRGRGGAR